MSYPDIDWQDWQYFGGKRPPLHKVCGPWVWLHDFQGNRTERAREGYRAQAKGESRKLRRANGKRVIRQALRNQD